jgi:hypothetical protein
VDPQRLSVAGRPDLALSVFIVIHVIKSLLGCGLMFLESKNRPGLNFGLLKAFLFDNSVKFQATANRSWSVLKIIG